MEPTSPRSYSDDQMKEMGIVDIPGDLNPVVRYVLEFRNQSKLAKWPRTMKTRQNWDSYWERHDFGHKIPGQSRETIAMVASSVERTAAMFIKAIAEIGENWFRVAARNQTAANRLKIQPKTIGTILKFQLGKAKVMKHLMKGLKAAFLGSVFTTKVGGTYVVTPHYTVNRLKKFKKMLGSKESHLDYTPKKYWQLDLALVNDFNWYPDPTGEEMGYCEDMWIDYHKLIELSEGEDAIYDREIVNLIAPGHNEEMAEERFDELRKTGQNNETRTFRNRVKVTEYFGNILDIQGKLLYENCVVTLANDRWLIRPPTPNPNWHQESPYEWTPLFEPPFGVWPRALMDAPVRYNIAKNEIFNLLLDGAMRAANNVTQVRQTWLEDPSQVSGGIEPGAALNLNEMAPPGQHAVERLETGEVPPESMQMMNFIDQEYNRAAFDSDIRQGLEPRKQVPATQIVEANQTITGVLDGLGKNVEGHVVEFLEKSWMTCCQFIKEMDQDELKAILDDAEYAKLDEMSAEELFENTVGGLKFTVEGISIMAQKAQDYQRDATLMQTIASNPIWEEAFVKKYSPEKLLDRAMRNLGIRTEEIEISEDEQEMMKQQQQQAQSPPGPQGPDMASQVPSPQQGNQQQQMGSAAPIQSTLAAQAAQGRPV